MPIKQFFRLHFSLSLLLGFLSSVLLLGFFAFLSRQIVGETSVVRFDSTLANALHVRTIPSIIHVMRLLTMLGSQAVIVLGLVIGLWFYRHQWFWQLGVWATGLIGGELLNFLLKLWFRRSRPMFENPIIQLRTFSFPSGHAMMSLITYGLLAYILLLRVHDRNLRLVIIVTTIALIALIGFTRMYLGAHFFSDVIAGYAAGGVWLIVTITAMRIAHRRDMIRTGPAPDHILR
jgi:undecaprenyl-diphosphatase